MEKEEGKMSWILMAFFISSSLFPSSVNGLTRKYSAKNGNLVTFPVSDTVQTNEVLTNNTTSMLDTAEIESLCLRMHNNTAFMGVQPYLRLVLYSASECRRKCIDLYPECVAVMFYYLHERNKNHICYLFSKNSIDEDVALVAEKPMKKLDMIRSLEIVADCHQFDPFPPLVTNFTASTDGVSKRKRDVGYDRPVEATGPWSLWSECSPRSGRQVRSQLCEYGRNIQLRRCSTSILHRAPSSYSIKIMSHAPSIAISISYPPHPYQHPVVTSDEYKRIMSTHSEQMAQSCCYWQGYSRQNSTNATTDQKMQIQQHFGVAQGCPTTCPMILQPQLQPPTYGQTLPQQPVYGQLHTQLPVDSQLQPQAPLDGQSSPQLIVDQVQPLSAVSGQVQPGEPFHGPIQSQTVISEWSTWSEWSFCSATCGIGVIQRYRICSAEQCIGENIEWRTCDQVVSCIASWAQWTSWSTCSATCGMGKMARSRYCYLGEGHCTGSDHEEEACETAPCPGWGQWQPWSQCSVTCGSGGRTRMRVCGGNNCIGDTYQQTHCNQPECEEWSEWQEWSACSVSCGEGVIARERVCMGRDCVGESSEQSKCLKQPCSTWQEWGQWSTCSTQCNFGVTTRKRLCDGSFCPGKRVEVMPCHAGRCVMWSTWQEWSKCSVTCGTGIQQRYCSCIGEQCSGNAEDMQYCQTGVSCLQWTKWTAWSGCSRECGIGERIRYRKCPSVGESADNCVGEKSETAVCLKQLCCEWTAWTSWTPCSHRCGTTGRSSRTRMCLRLGYEQDDSSCTGHCYGDFREDKNCSPEQLSCAARAYPTVCIPAEGYTPDLHGTVVTPSTGKPCPSGYLPAPSMPSYVSTTLVADYATPGYTGALPTSTSHAAATEKAGVVSKFITPGYPAKSPGYGPVPDAIDYTIRPGAPSHVVPTSASGYVLPGITNSYIIVSPGYVVPARTIIEIRCHWAEWYQWSTCKETCYHHVKRRFRHCIGDDCICSGEAHEEMDCMLSSQCKI